MLTEERIEMLTTGDVDRKLRGPIARPAYPLLAAGSLILILSYFKGWSYLFYIIAVIEGFIILFFRNPSRKIDYSDGLILSPADGRVVEIAMAEEKDLIKEKALKISIFMSLADVHVNRSPVEGKIAAIRYIPGMFFRADNNILCERNERNCMVIEDREGRRIVLKQIAGKIARRIVCYASPGDVLRAGDRFGIICFGSRVELYFPDGISINVMVGQKVKGGKTIIGYWQ